MPRLLFIGDIVGRPGRETVRQCLPSLREELSLDFVIANAENAAGGAGLTATIAHELLGYGCDALTLGDHVWDQRGFEEEIKALPLVCRPFNLPGSNPGATHLIVEKNGLRLAVATFLGRHFLGLKADCPFLAADRWLAQMHGQADATLAEIHAEATSEKVAFGWFLDGRATCVLGTHTHIPTADATVLPRGTGYLTDVGMTGPYASVIGREIAPSVARFLDGLPRKHPVAEADRRLCAALVEFDPCGVCSRCELLVRPPDTA